MFLSWSPWFWGVVLRETQRTPTLSRLWGGSLFLLVGPPQVVVDLSVVLENGQKTVPSTNKHPIECVFCKIGAQFWGCAKVDPGIFLHTGSEPPIYHQTLYHQIRVFIVLLAINLIMNFPGFPCSPCSIFRGNRQTDAQVQSEDCTKDFVSFMEELMGTCPTQTMV